MIVFFYPFTSVYYTSLLFCVMSDRSLYLGKTTIRLLTNENLFCCYMFFFNKKNNSKASDFTAG
jgi:hypothetical protein